MPNPNPCDPPPPPSVLRTTPPPAPVPTQPPAVPDAPQPPPQSPEPSAPKLPGYPLPTPTPNYADGPLPPYEPGQPGYVPPTPGPATPDTQANDFITPGPSGRVPVAGGVALPAADPGDDAPYRRAGCTTEFAYHSGLVQMPVAQAPSAGTPKPACVTGRRYAPYTRKTVRYFAERAGAQPLVPLPEPDGATQVLLDAQVVPDQPFLDPGASAWIYRVAATYVYALYQPRTPDQGYDVAVPVFSTLNAAEVFLPPQNFVGGIAGTLPPGTPLEPVGGLITTTT